MVQYKISWPNRGGQFLQDVIVDDVIQHRVSETENRIPVPDKPEKRGL